MIFVKIAAARQGKAAHTSSHINEFHSLAGHRRHLQLCDIVCLLETYRRSHPHPRTEHILHFLEKRIAVILAAYTDEHLICPEIVGIYLYNIICYFRYAVKDIEQGKVAL